MPNPISAPRQVRLKPVLQAASKKVISLDALYNSFPPQGEAGIWGSLPICPVLNWVEGLWQLLVQIAIFVLICSQTKGVCQVLLVL